jgi:SAM-dependent methyltransferase
MPTEAYLRTAYPEGYYSYQPPPRARPTIVKSIAAFLGFDAARTGDPAFAVPGRMVDIGCGSGAFLEKMRDKGWSVLGVELDLNAARIGQRERALDIRPGTVHEAALPDAAFDYVRMNHSFEHVWNPEDVLSELRRIIKPTGKLFIGVPNVASLEARVFGPYWWNLGAPVHPFGYNPKTLSRLLERNGFHVEQISFNSNMASVLGSIQIFLNRGTDRLSHEGRVMRNTIFKIASYAVAKLIDLFRRGDCMEIIARPK